MVTAVPSGEKNIYLVEDDPGVRSSLIALLESHDFVVSAYASGYEFFNACPNDAIGCLLADINLPGMDGLEILDKVIATRTGLAAIIVTGFGDVASAVRAIKAGAIDFIEKPYTEAVILQAVERALSLASNRGQHSAEALSFQYRWDQLTDREREVFNRLVAGLQNKVIAFELGISARTVEGHRARIMEKMKAQCTSDLIRMGIYRSFSVVSAHAKNKI